MTIWRPDLRHRSGPRYRAIADAVADDVARGALEEGARLPTHRDLAAVLGVTVGTVSRGYAEAQRRGLISGEVGRGSFVRRDRARGLDLGMPARGEPVLVDLSLNFPVGEVEDRELAKALAALGRTKDLARLLEYLPHAGMTRHREAGAAWVARSGTPAHAAQIIVCSGAQHGLAIALAALTAPGDVVLTEALTYPVFKTLAGLLRLKVQGLVMDEQGIVPEAVEAACKSSAPKILYCIPTIQNPTAIVMPETRRRRLAAVAQAHGLTILEDDIYGLLPADRPPPLARHAPESTVYVTSLSKTIAPGLRIGYLCAPRPLIERMIPAIAATTWMAPPLMAEIASRWIDNGTADAILRRKRAQAAERQKLAARILKTSGSDAHPSGYHLWLPLPEPWRGADFATRLRERGVAVTPAEVFVAGSAKAPPAVRLCLGAARTADRLERALRVVAGMLEGTHQPELSVV